MTRLSEMFNVNHFIVSQVNPHVVSFLAHDEDTMSSEVSNQPRSTSVKWSWLWGLSNFAHDEVLHRMHVLAELGVFPNMLTKARSILSQRYAGDITIFPEIRYRNFPKVLSNPTTEFMLKAKLAGERATWPKLSRIRNHCAIELALDDAVQQLRARIAFSRSELDLRSNVPSEPMVYDREKQAQRGRRRSHASLRQMQKPSSPLSIPKQILKNQGPRGSPSMQGISGPNGEASPHDQDGHEPNKQQGFEGILSVTPPSPLSSEGGSVHLELPKSGKGKL